MKRTYTHLIVLLAALMFVLTSCSVNNFSGRRNHQPRVRVEAANPVAIDEVIQVNHAVVLKKDTLVQLNRMEPTKRKITNDIKPKETIMEKVVKAIFPKKKELLTQILHPKENKLSKIERANLDDTEITGLVISLIALALAITSLFMIIGMAHVNLWAFFIVGMLLACVAIGMAFIAKRILPFKGISLAAGALGILAIVVILIFLVLILVGIVF